MSHASAYNPTKKLLAESLKKLMAEKPLNKISVYEIAEDCGVNRQTFYYHFHDIFDLLDWTFREEARELFNDWSETLSLEEGLLRLLEYIRINEAICLSALHSMGHKHLRNFFHDGVGHIILSMVNEHSFGLNVSEEHKIFIAHFYTVSFAGFIENWLQEGLKDDPEEIVRLCEVAMRGNIRGALERFSENTTLPASETPAGK